MGVEDSASLSELGGAHPFEVPDLEARRMRSHVARSLFGDDDAVVRFGRYVVEERLGRGGLGVVYRGHDPELGRDVALKIVPPTTGPEQVSDVRRMIREARAQAQVNHPNVVQIYDVGETDGEMYIAMELIRGSTLGRWLGAERPPWRRIIEVFTEAARGLVAAHEAGLIHRDFKPSNVMLGDDGRVRVLDFGLAKAAPAGTATPTENPAAAVRFSLEVLSQGEATGGLSGTPLYMAPEQLRGEPLHPTCDVFSFCVALFESIYTTRPFVAESAVQLLGAIERGQIAAPPRSAPAIPVRLRRAILRGLKAEPSARWPCMRLLLAELEAVGTPPRRWAQGLTVALGAAAVGVAALALTTSGGSVSDVSPAAAADSGAAAAIDAGLSATLATAEHLRREGRYAAVVALLAPVAEAQPGDSVGAAPTWLALGVALRSLDDRSHATVALERAFFLARSSGNEEIGRRAAAQLACHHAGAERHKAVEWLRTAQSVASPAGGASDLELQSCKAQVAEGEARYNDAIEGLAPVLEERRRAAVAEPLALASTLSLLGKIAYSANKTALALESFDEAVALFAASLRPEHPRVGRVLTERAFARLAHGDVELALSDGRRALDIVGKTFGPASLATVDALTVIGLSHRRGGRHREALEHLHNAAEVVSAVEGALESRAGKAWMNLAFAYRSLERREDAEAAYARARAYFEHVYAAEDPSMLHLASNRANNLLDMGRTADAREAFAEVLEIEERVLGPEDPKLVYPLTGLGTALHEEGRSTEAIPLLQRSVRLRIAAEHDPRQVAWARFDLAQALWDAGETREALALANIARDEARAVDAEYPLIEKVSVWMRARR